MKFYIQAGYRWYRECWCSNQTYTEFECYGRKTYKISGDILEEIELHKNNFTVSANSKKRVSQSDRQKNLRVSDHSTSNKIWIKRPQMKLNCVKKYSEKYVLDYKKVDVSWRAGGGEELRVAVVLL